jgi:hypothetical protein
MTFTTTATIIPGQGDAATNHRALIPRIAMHFPEVAKCSAFGTINLHLDQPFDRSRADFWTQHIPWIPIHLGGAEVGPRAEAFGFIRVVFECPFGGAKYKSWIILPEGASLTYREDHAEVIAAEFISGVSYGARCAVHVDHAPSLPAPPWFGKIYGKSLSQPGSL